MVGCAQSWDEPAFQDGPDGSFLLGFLTPHWDRFCCYCSEQSRLCFLRDCTCWAKVLFFFPPAGCPLPLPTKQGQDSLFRAQRISDNMVWPVPV